MPLGTQQQNHTLAALTASGWLSLPHNLGTTHAHCSQGCTRYHRSRILASRAGVLTEEGCVVPGGALAPQPAAPAAPAQFTVGVLPLGTSNDFAATTGIPEVSGVMLPPLEG